MIDPFDIRNSAFAIPHGGDERMEKLIEFRETLHRGIPTGESGVPNQSPFDNRPSALAGPANGKRDLKRKNGSDGPGALTIEARRELLTRLLKLQEQTGLTLISDDELFLIQQLWKSARRPDDGGGVARIVTRQKGIIMSDWKETNRLRELQEQISAAPNMLCGRIEIVCEEVMHATNLN